MRKLSRHGGDAAAGFSEVNLQVARALTAKVDEQQRLAFARAFSFTVMTAWYAAVRLSPAHARPQGIDQRLLSPEARDLAIDLGRSLARTEPRRAAHLIGVIYSTALPDTYRAAHGIFYTPPQLVDELLKMVESTSIDWSRARILDPACGGGAFLLAVADRIIDSLGNAAPQFILRHLSTQLHGFEIDPFGAWLAQSGMELALRDITQAAGCPTPNFVDVRDSLEIQSSDQSSFDLVVGNPPYGRTPLTSERRSLFQRSVFGHANLYGLFTDAALQWTRYGGVIGYVTPTSMLSGLYYKALRELLSAEARPSAITFVDERSGVFADVLQETILATYRRGMPARRTRVGFLGVGTQGNIDFREGGTFSIPRQRGAPWLLPRAPNQVDLSRRLQVMPARLRDYNYGVSTGPLVWNRFKSQLCQERVGARCYPIIWAESVTSRGEFRWQSQKRNHSPWFEARLPKDDWLIVNQPCVLLQRTTAKEQTRRLIAAELPAKFIRDHDGVVIENHLNMVRQLGPQNKVPAAVISVLLNSAVVDAAFRCINGSVAVSAFELEELPLPPLSVMAELTRMIQSRASRKEVDAFITAAYLGDDAASSA